MLLHPSTSLACVAFLFLCIAISVESLYIASFNVQIFGQQKMRNQDVVNALVKIIRRYDIVLMMEIRDTSGTSFRDLMGAINSYDTKSKRIYQYKISSPLGNTNSKEQYAFIYRDHSSIQFVDVFQYPDGDQFEREPFAIRFRTTLTALQDIALIGVHTDPDKAVLEMEALSNVHDAVKSHWKMDNILIMGDLNADCKYASKKSLNKLSIRTNLSFSWLIPDTDDTTTGNSTCAYDRFIVSGSRLKSAVVPNTAKVFLFDKWLNLSTKQTLAVSDHYPIEVQIGSTAKSEF